jgi:hypothetical protein
LQVLGHEVAVESDAVALLHLLHLGIELGTHLQAVHVAGARGVGLHHLHEAGDEVLLVEGGVLAGDRRELCAAQLAHGHAQRVLLGLELGVGDGACTLGCECGREGGQ